MSLFLVSAPAVEPITLAEVKRHLRVEVDDENDLIRGWMVAAREHVETYTGRALITQTWDWKLDRFPSSCFVLPLAPVTSITSISYLDTAGASQTWSAGDYLTDLPTGPKAMRGRITPDYGVSFPDTYSVMNAVTVRFVAGYGSTGVSVPFGITSAMKLLIGHWYEQRSAVNVGNIVTEIPITVDRLLWPYRLF